MSTLEIKGGLLELISRINDKQLLIEIYKLVNDVVEQNINPTDFWDELSEQQQKELDEALKESYNKKNLIDHKVVMEKYNKWLKQ